MLQRPLASGDERHPRFRVLRELRERGSIHQMPVIAGAHPDGLPFVFKSVRLRSLTARETRVLVMKDEDMAIRTEPRTPPPGAPSPTRPLQLSAHP